MRYGFACKRLAAGVVPIGVFLALPAMATSDGVHAAVAERTASRSLKNFMEMCSEGVPKMASDMLDMRAEGATRAQVAGDALRVYNQGITKWQAGLNDLKTQIIERGLTHHGATAIVTAMEQMWTAVYSTLPDIADAAFVGNRGRRWSKRSFQRYASNLCAERVELVTKSLARAVQTASMDAPSKIPAEGQCVPPGRESDMSEWFNFEQCLRIRRFKQLAIKRGEATPNIESLSFKGLLQHPVPAVRISWSDSVFFDTDSDEVLEKAKGKLRLVTDAMNRDAKDLHLFVIGHTDDTGGHGYNQELSNRRALNVMHELSALGVRKAQMTSMGMGEQQPVATNHTRNGRAANRRVEFMISSYEEVNHELTKMRKINAAFFRPISIEKEEIERLSNGGKPSDLTIPPVEDVELLDGSVAKVRKYEISSLTEKKYELMEIVDVRYELLSVPRSQE